LRTGQSQSFSANVTLSNGTTQAATPTWTSDNQSVLTIASSGQATAVAHGASTISASAQGSSATRAVRVYQDYQGTWSGSYRVRVCDEQGIFAGALCSTNFVPGTLLPIRITLTQTGASASGTVELGSIVNTLSGAVQDSRRYVGGGSGTFSTGGLTFGTKVGTFDVLSAATTLSGSIITFITLPGVPGNLYFEADLNGVTRTASIAQPSLLRPFSSQSEFLEGFRH
jgi:hypothetical protein